MRMKREEMADFLGVARPSLSRELMQMQREGLLLVEGKELRPGDRRLCSGWRTVNEGASGWRCRFLRFCDMHGREIFGFVTSVTECSGKRVMLEEWKAN